MNSDYLCPIGIQQFRERVLSTLETILHESFSAKCATRLFDIIGRDFDNNFGCILEDAIQEADAAIASVITNEKDAAEEEGYERGQQDADECAAAEEFEKGAKSAQLPCPCRHGHLQSNPVTEILLCSCCRREFRLTETQFINR